LIEVRQKDDKYPDPPSIPINQNSSRTVGSFDPNDKLGPAGSGDAAFVQADASLAYQIRFQNQPSATAPARQIIVTDTLDPNLNLDTFELTEISFGNQRISIPSGLNHYDTTVPMTVNDTAILADVQATLDRASRTLTVTLRAIDPATGWLPDDPLVGLLYPNDATGRGEGSISYRVLPGAGLPTSTVIPNRARITFDFNDPVDTPLVRNTLDAVAPTSRVLPLPATTTATAITVQWAGQDDPGGSGIAHYDLYVSQDGGAYALVLGGLTATSTPVPVTAGHTYGFYTIATDNVGHVELPPAVAEARITVLAVNQPPVLAAISNQTVNEGSLLTITAAATDPDAGDTYTFSLAPGAPAGARINPATGVFTWTPPEGPLTVSITIQVSDNGSPSLSDAKTFTVTVNNVPPTVNVGPAVRVPPGGTFSRQGSFVDPGADTWTAVVNYGDRSGIQPLALNPNKTFNLSHTYRTAGTFTLTVTVTEKNGGVGNGVVLVTVMAPLTVQSVVINDGSAQRSMVTSITVTFSGVVSWQGTPADAFQLSKQSGGPVDHIPVLLPRQSSGPLSLIVTPSVTAGRTVVVITFTGADVFGHSLPDGRYTLTIQATRIHDDQLQDLDGDGDGVPGGNRVEKFFRLCGDSAGKGFVDEADFWLFLGAFGKRAGDPGYLWYFDFDGNGVIDQLVDDYEFRLRYFQRI
jgi:hypothetical protein